MSKRLFYVCIFLHISIGNIFSQSTEATAIDSTLLTYYNKCMQVLRQPEALLMADTLYDMAAGQNNAKMQAVALCTKLDHYYYGQDAHKADSIKAWVERIRIFARQTKQPTYYYFVWSARLIRSYIRGGEYNLALLETEKMLREAEAEDFKEGIADCYNSLTNIYTAKRMKAKIFEFSLKELEIKENYNLERYNISLKYSNVARFFAEKGEYDKSDELLSKAVATARSPYHKYFASISDAFCNIQKDDMEAAAQKLKESRLMYDENPVLHTHRQFYYAVELEYYYRLKRYNQALRVSHLWEEALMERDETVSMASVLSSRADIYWEMGKKEEAGNLYRQLLNDIEEDQLKHEEITTAEFATLLDVQKLNVERNDLFRISQKRKIQNTRIIVVSLVALLLIVIGFLYRQYILYRKLKRSRDRLDQQNQMLLKTREDLKQAHDMAEQSSRMKTLFIQSMSHEIRTPLNSIVGFSAVLADMFSESDGDVLQYAGLIEENSRLLLKMIGDILDISALDEMDQDIARSPVDLNKCCTQSVRSAYPSLAEGVELKFMPARESAIINCNEAYLSQVLDNLLQNAVKFTGKGSITLAYCFENDDRQLVITVTDTGIGIPSDKKEYVFQRFVKLNEFSQGNGLGLSISRMIAIKFGGTLKLDEKYSAGARLIFSIPV